jgi:hypothetical protein
MPAALAWMNYVTADGTAIAAGSSLPSLPPSNLTNPIGSPSIAWQTAAGVVTAAAGATLRITPASPGTHWRAVGVFRTNLTPQATVTFILTGGGATVWTSALPGPAIGFGQVLAILPADTVADSLTINFDDPNNPDLFINVPLAFCGQAWIPETGPAWSSAIGRDDSTDTVTSRGGQEEITLLWQRRRWELALDGIRAEEVWTDVDAMRFTARLGGNVLFVPNYQSAYMPQEAIYGVLHETADITFP